MTTDLPIIFDQYLARFPTEYARVAPFAALLQATTPQSIIHRKTLPGHITASAFILNPQKSHVLLLHHRFLNRWLQPGGHVESADPTLPAAALREVTEETGIPSGDLTLIPLTQHPEVPLDIDIHPIPENKSKSELPHFHHDFRYLFLHSGPSQISLDPSESKNFAWQDLPTFAADPTFTLVAAKIKNLLDTAQASSLERP